MSCILKLYTQVHKHYHDGNRKVNTCTVHSTALLPTHLVVLIRRLAPQDKHELLHHTEAGEHHGGRGDIEQRDPAHLCQLGLDRHTLVRPCGTKQEGYTPRKLCFTLIMIKETDQGLNTSWNTLLPETTEEWKKK